MLNSKMLKIPPEELLPNVTEAPDDSQNGKVAT